MNKKIIFTALFALVAVAGLAQVKCHIEGEILNDKYGNDVVICEFGLDVRILDDPSIHVKAVNGKFSTTIESDCVKMYEIFLKEEYDKGAFRVSYFLLENGTVRVVFPEDEEKPIIWTSDGEEGHKRQVLYTMLREKYYDSADSIGYLMERSEHRAEYVDPVKGELTEKGKLLMKKQQELYDEGLDFEYNYLSEHPMLWTLYETLKSLEILKGAHYFSDFDPIRWERYVKLYHDKLYKLYPNHPIHEQIATLETAYHLQPGKPYIDYSVRNTDGQLVPISSLIKGKVALIDLWASWCGPCRRHSKAMIPIYEKYKDKGFTVIAIARERKAEDMQIAAQHDGYPWPCLLELRDENRIWLKNGVGGAGGAMFLIDRDGTILSTSNDAQELEPIIKKALRIE